MEIQKRQEGVGKRKTRHLPVLTREVIDLLRVKKNKKYIDTTVGGGGHTEAIIAAGGKVLGLDADELALKMAAERLSSACPADALNLVHGNFANLEAIARQAGFYPVSGVLFDLGISSDQLEDAKKGFSFSKEGPLDMRLDPKIQGVTAADLINSLTRKELYEIFFELAGEKLARHITAVLERTRRLEPIKTTRQLALLVEKVYRQHGYKWSRIHPATKVFLALRMVVNSELENLKTALPQAVRLLKKEGRLVVISFHSGEDRIVKNFLREQEKEGILKTITKKPIEPTKEEQERNPRSRSAKLRAGVKQ